MSDIGRRYISYVERGISIGWVITVPDGKDDYIRKYFSFAKNGGKRKALIAAKKHRDVLMKKNNIDPQRPTRKALPKKHAANTSGVIGVQFFIRKRSCGEYPEWVVQYRTGPHGQRRSVVKSFSVNFYGYQAAFKMALKCRMKGIGKPVPRNLKAPPMSQMLKKR